MPITGQVDLGRSSPLKQGEGALHLSKSWLKNTTRFEPGMDHPPLQGRVKRAQYLHGEYLMRRNGQGETREEILFLGKDLGAAQHCSPERGPEEFIDKWQDFESNFIAGGIGDGVGGILPETNLPLLEVGKKDGFLHPEKRAVKIKGDPGNRAA